MPIDDEQEQNQLTKVQVEPPSSPPHAGAASPVDQPELTVARIEELLAGPEHACTLGQYRIVARLGSGGMGHVYRAVHSTMGRTVAIKVMSPRLTNKERAQARFQHEVRGAARLRIPTSSWPTTLPRSAVCGSWSWSTSRGPTSSP